jgi:hypothetical protein
MPEALREILEWGFRERYSGYADAYDGMFLPTSDLIYLG